MQDFYFPTAFMLFAATAATFTPANRPNKPDVGRKQTS